MAVSEVTICNLALQKLGEARITSLSEDSPRARSCNAAYEFIRDRELRAHKWNFAKKRATLAPSSVTPDFDFDDAFPLPTDFLRLLPPNTSSLDWQIENHEGSPSILTNDGDTLEIVYIARITDTAKFDMLFVEMLACKLALHLCEDRTQSNTKKADIQAEYRELRREARLINAFENGSEEPPEDSWLLARR